MFKKQMNENELAVVNLLGLEPEFAVVTRDKNGQYFVIDLTEDDEEEYPYRITMHKPIYNFDGKRESVPKQIVGAIEFDIKPVENGNNAVVVNSEKVIPDAFARDNLYKFLEGCAKFINDEYKDTGASVVDLILIQGANAEGKKNGFVPYTNLGYNHTYFMGQSCAVKRSSEFQDRKFNNSFAELYDQFEKIIPTNVSERE